MHKRIAIRRAEIAFQQKRTNLRLVKEGLLPKHVAIRYAEKVLRQKRAHLRQQKRARRAQETI